jgi:hypothetical protein
MGERRGAYRASVGKPEGRRPLERPRHRWEDNIKMDRREVGQVAGSCEYGDEPWGSIKCGEFLEWLRTFQLLRKNSVPWS